MGFDYVRDLFSALLTLYSFSPNLSSMIQKVDIQLYNFRYIMRKVACLEADSISIC
jgi:hypothetical protein